jgi:hypothetical protein
MQAEEVPRLGGAAIRSCSHGTATLAAVSGGAFTRVEVASSYTGSMMHAVRPDSPAGIRHLLAPGPGRRAAVREWGRMRDTTVDDLILDLLEWVGPESRPYADVMDAWRTSCPRLPVWEDANDRGFIERHRDDGRSELISVSAAGAEFLRQHRAPIPR